MQWKDQYQVEISQAKSARVSGNEGMARVCARRAVGILLGEYFSQQGIPIPGPSGYDRIRVFQNLSHLNPQIRDTIEHFLIHVSPDRTLPGNIDLIAEAEWLASNLLADIGI
jgi:hypothetical protein